MSNSFCALVSSWPRAFSFFQLLNVSGIVSGLWDFSCEITMTLRIPFCGELLPSCCFRDSLSLAFCSWTTVCLVIIIICCCFSLFSLEFIELLGFVDSRFTSNLGNSQPLFPPMFFLLSRVPSSRGSRCAVGGSVTPHLSGRFSSLSPFSLCPHSSFQWAYLKACRFFLLLAQILLLNLPVNFSLQLLYFSVAEFDSFLMISTYLWYSHFVHTSFSCLSMLSLNSLEYL